MDPCLVISPHYDDAALSCGQFLAGRPDAWVATVCTAIPPGAINVRTSFDEHSGFANALDAMVARRLEDRAALGLLGVDRRIEIGYTDRQYRGNDEPLHPIEGSRVDLVDILELHVRELCEATPRQLVLAPLGIGHPDHADTSDAAMGAVARVNRNGAHEVDLVLYEELPYRVLEPVAVFDRADLLGLIVERDLAVIGSGPLERKRQAVGEYRSQLWAVDGPACYCPERFWRVLP